MNENTEGQKINNKYLIQYKIGKGTFGDIYVVTDGNSVYVAKIENFNSKNPQLIKEAKIITHLQGGMGIPAISWYGKESLGNIMIIEFLGPNLEDLFNLCDTRFSLKTVIMLADQFLLRIEFLHSRSYIHRDLKPENFVVGLGKKSSIIHLIDYGLSKQYRDTKTHIHSDYNENKQLVGTARYASINSHLGVELSRRDDLESIGYMLVYFLRGHLPWQGVKAANKQEKYHKIMEKKMSLSPEELCWELPRNYNLKRRVELSHYLSYCRSLGFEDKPDYTFLRRLFYQMHAQFDYEWDYIFDWNLPISADCNKQYNNGNVSINVNLAGNTKLNLTDDKTPMSSEVSQRRKNKSLSKKTVIKKTSFKAEEFIDCQTEQHPQSKKSKTIVDSYSMSSKVPSERKQTIFNARNFVTKQSIYDRIGGQMAIDVAVEKLYSRLPLDPVVGKFFLNTDLKRQVTRQKEFLSMMLGGPTFYKGRQMKEIHQNIGISETHYEIVVQQLADILEELGVDENVIQEIRVVLDTLKDDILCK